MMINKDFFVKVINNIEEVSRYHERLNEFYKTNGVDGYIYQPDCTVTIIELLHNILEDLDKDEWIDYFCFDLDFGKKWEIGMIKDNNGNDVKLESAEDLWEFLYSNKDNEVK